MMQMLFAVTEQKQQNLVSEFNSVWEKKIESECGEKYSTLIVWKESLWYSGYYQVCKPSEFNCKMKIRGEQVEDINKLVLKMYAV